MKDMLFYNGVHFGAFYTSIYTFMKPKGRKIHHPLQKRA